MRRPVKKYHEILALALIAILYIISPIFLPATVWAQSASQVTCYSNNQFTNKPERAPAGVCNYDALKSAGFVMGNLPNPFPTGQAICYYFPDSGDPTTVDCNDPKYKNAPEWGQFPLPPVSTKCYSGENSQYKKVDCTIDFETQIGSALEGDKCYLVDTTTSTQYKGVVDCNKPIIKAAEDAALAAKSGGSVNPGTPSKCGKGGEFFGLPTWYEFLPPGDNCSISLQKTDANGVPQYDNGKNVYDFNKLWLVALAIADILLWIAGLVAVLFVIYGGYQYITSQFDPEGTKKAKDTIINALIGLSVAILSSAIVRFVGSKL